LDKIAIDNMVLKPKDAHSYLGKHYVFESKEEVSLNVISRAADT
jgi:hypothetical protein